jgi:hypothetical protein
MSFAGYSKFFTLSSRNQEENSTQKGKETRKASQGQEEARILLSTHDRDGDKRSGLRHVQPRVTGRTTLESALRKPLR